MARKKCISWQKAEEIARRRLKREFKQEFTKKEIVIGNTARSFDLVSDNGKIIAQVKSCQKKRRNLTDAQIATRFKRGYVFDCLLLDRVNAQEKIFFLASDEDSPPQRQRGI